MDNSAFSPTGPGCGGVSAGGQVVTLPTGAASDAEQKSHARRILQPVAVLQGSAGALLVASLSSVADRQELRQRRRR